MKTAVSRKMYLKQLKRGLRFRYTKDDIDSILNDYNEIFDVEIAQGKSEEDVCMSLGGPHIIVQNLSREMNPKKIFSGRNIAKSVLIAMIFFVIANIIYNLKHSNASYLMIGLLIFYPVTALLLWFMLKSDNRVSPNPIAKNNLMQIKVAHIICFLIAFSLFFFFNNISMNLKGERIGIFVVRILYILIALLCGMILHSTFKFKENQVAFYSVICHALGVIAIILYDINALHSLTSLSLFFAKIIEGGFIYLETIIISIFLVFSYKRKEQRWMHN